MSVRNVRAHQSRGLLPPPERRGRVAYYGAAHERALRRIQELQAAGYNLTAVTALMRQQDADVAALQRLVLAPLLEPDEVRLSWSELAEMFETRPSRDRRRKALAAGLLEQTSDGEVVAPSRRLIEGARTLLDMGVPLDAVFELQVEISSKTQDIAHRFVETCLRCALEPFGGDEVPVERWDDVRERFELLRRQMASVLAATFSVNVRRATEAIVVAPLAGSAPAGR